MECNNTNWMRSGASAKRVSSEPSLHIGNTITSSQPTKKKLKPISDTSVNQSSTVSSQNNNNNKKPFKDLVKQEAASSKSENTISGESQIVEKRSNNSNRKKVKGTASKEITKSKESQKESSALSKSVSRSSSDSAVLEQGTPIDKIQRLKSDSDILPKSSKKRKRKEVLFYSPKRLRSSSSISKEETHSSSTAAKTGSRNSRLRSPRGGSSSSAQSSNSLGSCARSRRHRRWRSRNEPPAMENEAGTTSTDNPDNAEANEDQATSAPLVGASASLGNTESASSQDGDIELGLEEGDMSRLQALLEARGLPAHLFGSLGPRMHLLLHKTFNSGAGSKAQQLITSMQSDDEGTQLQGAMEMCQLLVMGNEETLAGFPIKQVVPVLVTLLQMEHNFDIMNHACRALTYLMEALPRSSNVVVEAVPALLEKLQTIQCMDVAEQSLTALEMLSKRHGKSVLQAGGLGSSLLFLDFFSIVAQRSALAITANCCHSITSEEFGFVKDSIQTLTNRLNNQDKKSLESVCTAFARLVDNVQNDGHLLESLCEYGLLGNMKQLLVISPPIISSNIFVMVIRMLAIMCSNCPTIAVKLLKLNIAETIRYLLIGSNDVPTDEIVELIPRSPQELYELTCLTSELLPKLPNTGIFSIDMQLNKNVVSSSQSCTWQWRDDRNSWQSYLWVDNRIIEAAYQGGEDEISLSTQGRNYIIDFSNMQQINEDTGTVRAIQRKSGPVSQHVTVISETKTLQKEYTDERAIIFDREPELGKNLVQSLIAVVYNVYFSSVGPAVKHKCLHSILKMLHYGPVELLKDVLVKIPISSYIASMMSSNDLRIICSSLQKADILMKKLNETFQVFFRREGVMHKIKDLADGNIVTSPSGTPDKNNSPIERRKESYLRSSSALSVKKSSSGSEVGTLFDEITSLEESVQPVEKPSGSSRLASLRSKKQTVKKLTRKRTSKNDILEDGTSTSNQSKKLSHETGMRPKSATLSSTSSYASGNSSKGSFFSNFAPRWGRSQSYSNTTPVTNTSSNKTFKERYAKEQEKNKEKIREWIKTTAKVLYERYFADQTGESDHPALVILKQLTTSSEELKLTGDSDLSALQGLRNVVLNEDNNADASPFEIVHSGMVSAVLRYLTSEAGRNETPRKTRIIRFINTFLGIKASNDMIHGKLIPSEKPALQSLVQKLNLCINQLEQFPVKCHDIPGANLSGGSRGSSALRFFNTRQIKCQLQRHPDCNTVKQWSGGAVKIDPLALVQAIERYLIVRGFGKVKESGFSLEGFLNDMSDEDEEHSDDGGELLVSLLQSSNDTKHVLEFVMNGHVLPHNMTVYQAVQQYGNANANLSGDVADDNDSEPFGPSTIWSATHTLFYRPVPKQNAKASPPTSSSGSTSSSKSRNTSGSIVSKSILKKTAERPKAADSSAFLTEKLPVEFCSTDPSIDVICLMRILYYLNSNWGKYVGLPTCGPVISHLEFINSKLTAKATRQLQDPLVIMTGNLPPWLPELAKVCPFVFPFECRQLLFYTSTFDRDRAVLKLQETIPDLASSDSNDRVTPRLEKKKRIISRSPLFKRAVGVIDGCINRKALLEIQYEGEVGTGLGPTLEFYALMSKEFQKAEYEMWRGDATIETEDDGEEKLKYLFAKTGLFPAPIQKNASNYQLTKILFKFRFLGKFIAKALMDFRMVDIPFSETFYKWMLNQQETIDLSDMINVDETLYKSLSQLHEVSLQKQAIINDSTHSIDSLELAINSLTLNGTAIEDIGLDFVLPGTNIELKKNGKDIIVNMDNIEEYLKLVVEHSMVDCVSKQMQAFKEGFEQFFPISSLKMFYPSEMDLLLCGSKSQQWQVKDLMECCRPDHGYTSDSRAVKFLFEILSKYNSEEQRMFLQFITGSPRLPVGGFKSLNPPLTIVRKTIENELNPDNYLPSVMTCVNYLKLPDYSSIKIMSEKLRTAYSEGKNAFHLS